MSRFRSGEPLVFAIATALTLIHALDDAFVHRGPGLGLGQHALAGAISIAAAVIAVLAFPGLRPGLRAAVAFAFGGLAIVNGMLHVIHISEHGAGGGDLTGALAVLGGVVLVALAVAIPWRHRGAGTASARWRWAKRVVAGPAGLLAAVFVLGPIALGIVSTHKWREPVGAPPSAAYESVTFRASDGLDLAGWYRPSENGAAVLLVHGGSSDRKGSVAHAELLARHGYGVLLYDARGRGESDGSENNYGWDWAKDIAGALDFLRERDDVDSGRVGALGLSTGADVLLEVAAERDDLAAIVADGAAAGSFADWHDLRGIELGTPPGWVMFKTIQVLSGDAPGPPLKDAVAQIESPTLLISAGETEERDFNLIYDKAATGPVEHWNLPGANHTDAIRDEPKQYEHAVISFYDDALR
jgi:poly(3-hydroxybutyrate) depolymerase